MGAKHRRALKSGLSMIELLIVVAIIALLGAVAVPQLLTLVPRYELRNSFKDTVTLMRRARLEASTSQRPVRVAIDCRNTSLPCTIGMEMAVFRANVGPPASVTLTGWRLVPGTRRNLPTHVIASSSQKKKSINDGTDMFSVPDSTYLAIFMPTARMRGSHESFELTFTSSRVRGAKWTMSVSDQTSRVTLKN